jgi:hypothetical protein
MIFRFLVLLPRIQYQPVTGTLDDLKVCKIKDMLEISSKFDSTKIVGFLPKSATKANCMFLLDIFNTKTPNLYKKWGFIIQQWQSPKV